MTRPRLVLLIAAALAASPAAAQIQQTQPQQMQRLPQTGAIPRGETLSAARPAGYLRIDGVLGESQFKPGWIEAISLAMTCDGSQSGEAGQDSRTGAGAGARGQYQDLIFSHRVDRASPVLFDALAKGKRFRAVEVDQLGTALKIEDVMVTRVTHTDRGTDRQVETVTLSYVKCTPH
jgi:type VI protein secretion system component Hcp